MEESCANDTDGCWLRNVRTSESDGKIASTRVGDGRCSLVPQLDDSRSLFHHAGCYSFCAALGLEGTLILSINGSTSLLRNGSLY